MKRKNKMLCLSVSIVLTGLVLCSCTGYTEIENMDILTSHFIYKNEDKIQLGGGIANVRSLSDSMADRPVSYISAQADTLYEASKKLQLSGDHKLFYGGIRALVIGQQYAYDGVGEFLDYVQTLPDHRATVSVFTSSSDARDIVEYKAVNDFSGGFAAESIVRTLQDADAMINCSLSQIWEAKAQKQVGFVVPDIEISNDIMSVSGYSVFDGEKKILHIDALAGAPLNYILSKKARWGYAVSVPEAGECEVYAQMTKKHIDVYENSGGVLCADMSFVFDITVNVPGDEYLTNEQTEHIKQNICTVINDEINAVLNMAKEHGCDFLQLYKAYQTKNRSGFYKLDWQKMISNMNISTNVSVGKIKNKALR